jgi:hypothetical protein
MRLLHGYLWYIDLCSVDDLYMWVQHVGCLKDFYYNTQILTQKHHVEPDVHVLALSGKLLCFVLQVTGFFIDFFCL